MGKNISEISFILLSHPHLDHFSGMLTLLEYCEKTQIKIKNYVDTCSGKKEYLRSAVDGPSSKRKLAKLYQKISSLYNESDVIEEWSQVPGISSYEVNFDGLPLVFYSPTQKEFSKFNKKEHETHEFRNNPVTNILSTIIKIATCDGIVLLTSDSVKYSFERILNHKKQLFKNNVALSQIPHHGSIKNHFIPFWREFEESDKRISVLSVGSNSFERYGVPSEDVINSFENHGYEIFSTNTSGSLSQVTTVVKQKTQILNKVTDVRKEKKIDKLSGHQSFQFNLNNTPDNK